MDGWKYTSKRLSGQFCHLCKYFQQFVSSRCTAPGAELKRNTYKVAHTLVQQPRTRLCQHASPSCSRFVKQAYRIAHVLLVQSSCCRHRWRSLVADEHWQEKLTRRVRMCNQLTTVWQIDHSQLPQRFWLDSGAMYAKSEARGSANIYKWIKQWNIQYSVAVVIY